MTAILNSIAAQLGSTLVKQDDWPIAIEKWGAEVALNREYIDGNHRHDYTTEMAQMLRVDKEDDERFSLNYSELVADKLSNRLNIERIQAASENEKGNEWIAEMLVDSSFGELQHEVTSATVEDGDTFVIIKPPETGENATWVHEPAWDNVNGVIPVYDNYTHGMVAVIKVWEDLALDTDRVNIYYDDRVEKYTDDGGLQPYIDESDDSPKVEDKPYASKWEDKQGNPLGIPFGHFRNRKKTRSIFGRSEQSKIRAPQDVLNRTFVSMTMTSELTAFQRLAFIGMTADGNVSPGSIWEIVERNDKGEALAGIPKDRFVDIKVIEPGEISPFVEQAEFTIEQISIISDTPIPSLMGGAAQTAESLAQREVGLAAKAKTSQVVMGNVWSALVTQTAKIQETFSTLPAEIEKAATIWTEVNIRDTAKIIDNAVKVKDSLDTTTYLKEIEPAMDFSIADIPNIEEARKEQTINTLNRLQVPGFDRLV